MTLIHPFTIDDNFKSQQYWFQSNVVIQVIRSHYINTSLTEFLDIILRLPLNIYICMIGSVHGATSNGVYVSGRVNEMNKYSFLCNNNLLVCYDDTYVTNFNDFAV